jgi:tetratricopeptide (TPR) repeat protein
MPAAASKVQSIVASCLCLLLGCLMLAAHSSRAGDYSFSNSFVQAAVAETNKDVTAALKIYSAAERAESTNSADLCVLARKFCDLMYLTKSADVQKDLAEQALACSLQAVKVDSNNATAHACVAVCYAKKSLFADIKTKLNYSRQIKLESEKTIALDPKQDIGYYLLGRWNYGVANIGLVSRAFVRVVYGGLPEASNAEAIANFKKAIKLAPDRILNHAGLAMVYETTGDEKLEIAELKKCRELKGISLEDEDAQRDAVQKLAALGQ